MSIFEEINSWSAEEFLSKIALPLARDGKSYVCPMCDNGTGETGDGIKPRISKGRVRWKCFGRCGRDFSNFNLAAAVLGIDAELDRAEAARRLKEVFGLYDDETFSFSRDKKSARVTWTAEQKAALSFERKGAVELDEKKSASEPEPKNYAKLYEFCRGNVAKFLAERGGSFRGIKEPTFEKYGFGVHPEFGVEGHEKCPHLIIPYDDNHFFARAIEGHDRSQHGTNAGLFRGLPISLEYPNFILEGELDAVSVSQELSQYEMFGVVATGGAAKYHKVVPELEKRFANAESKPSFIVVFDNDAAGKTNGLKLVHDLKVTGYPAELFFFEDKTAGEHEYQRSDGTTEKITVPKVDANDLLQRGEDRLIGRLFDAIEQTEPKLKAQLSALSAAKERERQAAENKSGIKDFPIAEYFSRQYFIDVDFSARYSERRTGFANLDGTGEFKHDGQKQIFFPALYLLGAIPGAGKTTYAWQLVNQLANAGEFCIYCSYEMSALELYSKSVACELFKRYPETAKNLKLSSANLRHGAGSNLDEVNKIVLELANTTANLRVLELTNTPVTELFKNLESFIEKAGKPPVVVVDYLQIIPSPNSRATAKEKIDDLMLRLKNFQRNTNSTLIVISAFNRASDQYEKPRLSSFRESSAIEYSSDVVWALNVKDDAMKQNPRPVEFLCLKNRNGAIYECYFNYYAANDYFQACKEQDFDNEDL